MIYCNEIPSWAYYDDKAHEYSWGHGIKGIVTNSYKEAVEWNNKLLWQGDYLASIIKTRNGTIKYATCDYISQNCAHNMTKHMKYFVTPYD